MDWSRKLETIENLSPVTDEIGLETAKYIVSNTKKEDLNKKKQKIAPRTLTSRQKKTCGHHTTRDLSNTSSQCAVSELCHRKSHEINGTSCKQLQKPSFCQRKFFKKGPRWRFLFHASCKTQEDEQLLIGLYDLTPVREGGLRPYYYHHHHHHTT